VGVKNINAKVIEYMVKIPSIDESIAMNIDKSDLFIQMQ
jgi:hypothetical protein